MGTALQTVKEFYPEVHRVIDATKPLTIEVTKADAKPKGKKNHHACAMAEACKRKLHLDGAVVSRSVAYLVKGTVAQRYKLPNSVAREVVSFDRGGGFSPGTYQLQCVSPTQKLGARNGGDSDDSKRKPAKAKRFQQVTTNMRTTLGGAKG